MRISDWSSDVCSSDLEEADADGGPAPRTDVLAEQRHCQHGHHEGRREQDGGGFGELQVLQGGEVGAGGAEEKERAQHPQAGTLARQSVGEGKEVAERLNLGGRGVLKQNKTQEKTKTK